MMILIIIIIMCSNELILKVIIFVRVTADYLYTLTEDALLIFFAICGSHFLAMISTDLKRESSSYIFQTVF